ncbi:MAG: M28 family peptidase [Bdellovibrionales bacterium]|nr:M28 family peptidase [Bdellovibrionales bacterium]
MKMRRIAARLGILGVLFHFGAFALAGDVPSVHDEAKATVAKLASPEFWGRGYTKDGMAKAAAYLEGEIAKIGLKPLAGASYRQPFEFPVQTFPGEMEVKVNGRLLVPGLDYIVSPGARGGKHKFDLVAKGADEFVGGKNEAVSVVLKDKLTWSVARKVNANTQIFLDRARMPDRPTRVAYRIETKFLPNFAAANIAGYVPGTVNPERLFLFTAHYDHLGGMGDRTFFPGANDNASGVSLILELAKYYAAHPQPYSIGFVFFAGEEAGLIGSKYFVEHPLVPLDRIRFVMNFDLEGTGEEGATVVNATEFPKEFGILTQLNNEGHYLVQIGSRGKAANSDHYWFTEHGVPAFFMYTMGGIKAYHDIFDKAETLPMTKIDDVFALTLKFGQMVSEEAALH